MNKKTIFLAKTATIAALYVALTLPLAAIAYGPVQFRLAEALTILPLFYLEAVPGLFIGCLLVNILGSTVIDVVLGSLATLIAAVLTYFSKKIYFGVIPPIIVNALLVPIIILSFPDATEGYFTYALSVGISQTIAIIGLGVPFFFALKNAMRKNVFLRPTRLLGR